MLFNLIIELFGASLNFASQVSAPSASPQSSSAPSPSRVLCMGSQDIWGLVHPVPLDRLAV